MIRVMSYPVTSTYCFPVQFKLRKDSLTKKRFLSGVQRQAVLFQYCNATEFNILSVVLTCGQDNFAAEVIDSY